MKQNGTQTEVLTFQKGRQVATVVTDGLHFATYMENGRQWHRSMSGAVAHLESKGFKIIVDVWQ